jgi:dTDP-4-amino-4,6-dideoxygalactose transaminase
MDYIMELAKKHNLLVVEDAAHAIMAKYKGQWLGSIGHINTFSFHETKNYSSGEGGALLLNSEELALRAEIIREKGTNRSRFFRGEVDKYSWVDVGSSYLPSEIIAAFLYGQLECADQINNERLQIWGNYKVRLLEFEKQGLIRLPIIPEHCEHNAHMFYFLTNTPEERTELLAKFKEAKIGAVFHYIPLHTSDMGIKMGYRIGQLPITEEYSERLIRLPLFCGLTLSDQDRVCNVVEKYFSSKPSILADVANL